MPLRFTRSLPALVLLVAVAGCSSVTPGPSGSANSTAGHSASPVAGMSAELALATHLVAQEGLAVALASNVLQTQLLLVQDASTDSPVTNCTALSGGGAHRVSDWGGASGNRTLTETIYYDGSCAIPYLAAHATVVTTDSGATATASVAYSGMTGEALGTLTTSANAALAGSGINLEGTGTFTRPGTSPASLGLACQSTSDTQLNCQGGVAQDFTALGHSVGSITPLQLTTNGDLSSPITFQGSGNSTAVAATGALSIVSPDAATLAITGATPMPGSSTVAGQAGGFVLFPPTPTGWTITDKAHDVSFAITVTDNATRALSATVTQLSSNDVLATLTLDKSGTGTITYLGDTPAPITSWILTR